MPARSRMPPPSWTGRSTAARIASTAAPLTERPAKAPLRSTTCSHSKPASAKRRACAAGSALKTVALRHLAALEANAGAVLQVDGREEDHQVASGFPRGGGTPSSRVLPAPSPRRKPGPIAPGPERAKTAERWIPAFAGMTDGDAPKVEELDPATRSRLPFEEILDQLQPELLALLGVELRAGNGAAGDDRGDRTAIVGDRDDVLGALGDQVIAVQEIGVPAVRRRARCRRSADGGRAPSSCSSPCAAPSARDRPARSRAPRRGCGRARA